MICSTAQVFFLCLWLSTFWSLSLLLVELSEEKEVLELEGVNTRITFEVEAEVEVEETEAWSCLAPPSLKLPLYLVQGLMGDTTVSRR